MNLLQLCNRLISEAGITRTAMTTTAGQTGELGRVVNWIQSAWIDIQSIHQDWKWLRTSTSFVTIAGQAQYNLGAEIGVAVANFGIWDAKTFRNYTTAVGTLSEIFMTEIDYDAYRDSYLYGALRATQARPLQFAVAPNKGIMLGPVPAVGYTVTADYFAAPSEMADDTAIPEMPAQFHMAIVWRALMFYGGYEAASEAYQRGETEFNKILSLLERDRLPEITMGGPLA